MKLILPTKKQVNALASQGHPSHYQNANGGGNDQITPDYIVELFVKFCILPRNSVIWCPCDTDDSPFVRLLQPVYNVRNTCIADGQDFLTYKPKFRFDAIVTNPPYTDKRKFVERCLHFEKPWALLLPITALADCVFNQTLPGTSLQLLIPEKRPRFIDPETREAGAKPTFKASFFGQRVFENSLTLVEGV